MDTSKPNAPAATAIVLASGSSRGAMQTASSSVPRHWHATSVKAAAADRPDRRGVWHLGALDPGLDHGGTAGQPGIAIGNAIGRTSPILHLYWGTALIMPLTVRSDMLRREYPLLLAVSVGTFLLLLDGDLDRTDGFILACRFVRRDVSAGTHRPAPTRPRPLAEEIEAEIPKTDSAVATAIGWFLLGLAVLIVSSRMLVWGAVDVAVALGVSDLVIGLTIVAVGTSLLNSPPAS